MPKGVSDEIGVRRLAIQVEDHELEFAEFEGTIPAEEDGAGLIEIWDRGTYESREWTNERISLMLHGDRLCGLYDLIRFHRGGAREWLILKRRELRHN